MTSSLGTCGGYELLRFLDAGGMGEIFLARGPAPVGAKQPLALKRLLPHVAQDPSVVGMFMDEARLATRLEHPNIARVYGPGRDGENYFLVMEWIDGAPLRTLVRRTASAGPMPWNVAARIIADAALGLDYAHRLCDASGRSYEVVHRDVSPANVMVGYDGETRLLDFGLARARTQLEKTKPGLVKGKFAYLAPEQLRGEITQRVDVFQLGLCLWEALSGRPLIGESSPAAAMVRLEALREPPPISREDVPRGLDAILRRALAADPAQRYATARALRDDLEALMASEGAPASVDRVAAWTARVCPPPVDDEFARGSTVPPPAMQSVADLVDADPTAARPRWGSIALALIVLAGLAVAAFVVMR